MNPLPHSIYRLLNKFVPCDITQILLLELESCQQPSNDGSAFDFRFLSSDDVRRLSDELKSDAKNVLKSELAALIDQRQARCFAALDQGKLAAYSWFASDQVAAEHNSGGSKFAGIGLQLPEEMVYLFNAFVSPEYRGQSLNHSIFQKAGEQFVSDGKTRIITTTDWTNKAFQKSAHRGGFVKHGHAAEWIIGSRHFYHLPKLKIPGLTFFGGTN